MIHKISKEQKTHKTPCPKCGKTKALRLCYGRPSGRAFGGSIKKMGEYAKKEGIIFAGCCVEKEEWQCAVCGHQW